MTRSALSRNNEMSAATYAFRIGSLDCTVVRDGHFNAAARYLFSNAPADELAHALTVHNQPKRIAVPIANLLINNGRQLILVDTGLGTSDGAGLDKLQQHLQDTGIENMAIDLVIITHGHADHIGGLIGPDGDLSYPNARHVMSEVEWDFWTSEEGLSSLGEVQANAVRTVLLPLGDHLELVSEDQEIAPGLHLIMAPGHTPGHMILRLVSGEDQLLHIVDVVIRPIHLENPGWKAAADQVPDMVESTRREIFNPAAVEKTLLFANHFDFPCLGRVIPYRRGWQWQPISTDSAES